MLTNEHDGRDNPDRAQDDVDLDEDLHPECYVGHIGLDDLNTGWKINSQ